MKKKEDLYKKTIDFHDDGEIYDVVNSSFVEDVPFWKKWCEKAGKNVLELCSGTGRIGIPLIKAGFNYTGIDNSKDFLDIARKKAAKLDPNKYSCHFLHGDMRSFSLKQKFDSIIIPFNAFQHMFTSDDITRCMGQVKKHLRKGGLFIVNVFNPKLEKLIPDYEKERDIYKFPKKFSIFETRRYDKASQIMFADWHYKFYGQRKDFTKNLIMRVFYPQEFNSYFEANGFRIIHKFGDYKGRPFDSSSSCQVVIATR